jgi:hypothetical protein
MIGRLSRKRPGDSQIGLLKRLPPWAVIGLTTVGLIVGLSLILVLIAYSSRG